MQTVVEMPSYLKAAEAIFAEAESQDIVGMVAAEPECGKYSRNGWVSQGTRRSRRYGEAWGSTGDLHSPQ